jgi:translation elongation factor EF-G
LFGYATALRSLTQGRATVAMEFSCNGVVPATLATAVLRQ